MAHIILDYDSTIANSQKAICDLYNKLYCKHPDFIPAIWQDVKLWNMSDQCPLLYAEGKNVLSLFSMQEFFDLVEFYPDAVDVIDNWFKKGHDISICTAGSPKNISLKMLHLDDNFHYANIIPVTMRGSNGIGKSIVNMDKAIFVDDHLQNLLESNATKKILYQDINFPKIQHWNKEIDTNMIENYHTKVSTWKELDNVITSIIQS